MISDPNHIPSLPFQVQTELELLQLLLEENQVYPWNPAETEAEPYFAELEQELVSTGWIEDDFAAQGQLLASRFDALWATVATPDTTRSLINDLFERFAVQVPQLCVESIVQRAKQVVADNISLADKLVLCVQELLPGWGDDDLQVLARPFAFAMRSSETETLESTLNSVHGTEWSDLSSVEQARLSLAIARYAISQLPADEN